MNHLVVYPHRRHPLLPGFIPAYPYVAALIRWLEKSISQIMRLSSNAKIFSAVVQFVVIYMVYNKTLGRLHNKPMQERHGLPKAGCIGIPARMKYPRHAGGEWNIIGVYNSCFSSRQNNGRNPSVTVYKNGLRDLFFSALGHHLLSHTNQSPSTNLIA